MPILEFSDPDVLLYPALDFLNHSPTTANAWVNDSVCSSLICYDEALAGDEIFNGYGPKNNAQREQAFI